MNIVQLNPTIPLTTPKGDGLAHFYIWLSEEHHGLWVVCMDATGEWWTYENPQVRGTKNITFDRTVISDIEAMEESDEYNLKKVEAYLKQKSYEKHSDIDLGGC